MKNTAADDLREAELAKLKALLARVPPGIGDWFYQRTAEFKAAHRLASKVLGSKSPRPHKISEAIGLLLPFHKEKT